MEVILKKDVTNIGKAGTLVKVKEGFARNFLFPQHLAEVATPAALKKLEEERTLKLALSEKLKQEAIGVKERLAGVALTISALTQSEEKLYGSIQAQEITAALEAEGIAIEKSAIELAEPIKSLGIYEIPVKLHPEVTAKVKLWVVKK
jgi:large subunit ribosomal protein L9